MSGYPKNPILGWCGLWQLYFHCSMFPNNTKSPCCPNQTFVALSSANHSLPLLDCGHCHLTGTRQESRKSINWETWVRLKNFPIRGARIEKKYLFDVIQNIIIFHSTFPFIMYPFNGVKWIIKTELRNYNCCILFRYDNVLFVNEWKRKSLNSFFLNLSNQSKWNCFSCEVPKCKYYSKKIYQTEKKTRCKQQTEEIKDKSMNMDQMRPLPGSFGRQEWCHWKEEDHINSIFEKYISFVASFIENQCCFFSFAAPEHWQNPTEGTRHLTLLSWKIRLGWVGIVAKFCLCFEMKTFGFNILHSFKLQALQGER